MAYKKTARKKPAKRKPAKKKISSSNNKTMSKRKKSGKRTTTKRRSSRRRVSGIGSVDLTSVALAIGGAIGGQVIAKNLLPSMDAKIKNAVVAVAGLYLIPSVLKGATGQALGMGMAIGGGLGLVKETRLIGYVSNMPLLGYGGVAGPGISNMVSGAGVQAQVAGVPESSSLPEAEVYANALFG